MTRPSGRGKKSEAVWQSIDDRLLVTKQHQNLLRVAYQDSLLLVQASRLTYFGEEPILYEQKHLSSAVPEMERAADMQRTRAAAQSTLQGKQETNDFDVFL